VTYHRAPGLALAEHEFTLPVDHDRPAGPTITVFAREVAAPDGRDRPYLLFLRGGPGHEAPRPIGPANPPWLATALCEYRVLLLDQRGTGRSSPIEPRTEAPPRERAEWLTLFRADAIVRDAEAIRRLLGVERWSVLGQSFGGFCVTTYLSRYPDGLREAFITGGLPPLDRHVDETYAATYDRVRQRLDAYFERYPGDRDRVAEITERLEREDVRLPAGDRLTGRRFQQIGRLLGASDGFERLHYALELPFGSPAFLHDIAEAGMPFARNPLYAVLHEACHANGGATRWSAARLRPDGLELTGEHVFPWVFEDYAGLRPFAEVAEILAEHEWGRLYDAERLRTNKVPAAAAIYIDDMHVERRFAEETARAIGNLRPWITNEYQHDGVRVDGGDRVLARLIDLVRDRA
jgi:pimeloyl-ACP methyl ester carboxylesterase